MDLKKPAILSISLLTVMTNAAVAPVLGLITISFPDAGNTLIKQVVTIPSLMIIIFSILSGMLVKVIAKKAVLAIGLSVYLVGAFFARASASITELILFRALMGAGGGLIVPLAASLITDFYDGPERARMVGYSTFTSYIGAALAQLLSGWLASTKWQDAFFIYALALLVLVFTMIFIPHRHIQTKTAKPTTKKFNPSVLYLALMGCGIYIIFYLVPTDVSFLIKKIETATPSHAAALLAVEILAAASAGVLFSHYTRKMGKHAFPLGFGLMAVGFFLVFLSTSTLMLLLSMVVIGLGSGTLRPLIYFQTSQRSSPENMTTAFALVNSGFSLGQFISPFFYYGLAWIVPGSLLSENYLSASLILLCAAACAFFYTFLKKTPAD